MRCQARPCRALRTDADGMACRRSAGSCCVLKTVQAVATWSATVAGEVTVDGGTTDPRVLAIAATRSGLDCHATTMVPASCRARRVVDATDRWLAADRSVGAVMVVCAGINRHGEGDERALHRRSSD